RHERSRLVDEDREVGIGGQAGNLGLIDRVDRINLVGLQRVESSCRILDGDDVDGVEMGYARLPVTRIANHGVVRVVAFLELERARSDGWVERRDTGLDDRDDLAGGELVGE